jgi:hypothetical protein
LIDGAGSGSGDAVRISEQQIAALRTYREAYGVT